MSLSNNQKQILVIGMRGDTDKDPDELLQDGINNVNAINVQVIRTVITESDNSTIEADIKEAFSDYLSVIVRYYVYDIGDVRTYISSIELEEE